LQIVDASLKRLAIGTPNRFHRRIIRSLGTYSCTDGKWRIPQLEVGALIKYAIRFGVILRKVWGGSRTWPGARAQSVLMSVWRTCGQQGRSALDFLSQLLRGPPAGLALPS
jgi:transposase